MVTYILLALEAVESIVVYHFFHWKRLAAEKQERKDAMARYKQRRKKSAGSVSSGRLPTVATETFQDAGEEEGFESAEEEAGVALGGGSGSGLSGSYSGGGAATANGAAPEPSSLKNTKRIGVFAIFGGNVSREREVPFPSHTAPCLCCLPMPLPQPSRPPCLSPPLFFTSRRNPRLSPLQRTTASCCAAPAPLSPSS